MFPDSPGGVALVLRMEATISPCTSSLDVERGLLDFKEVILSNSKEMAMSRRNGIKRFHH